MARDVLPICQWCDQRSIFVINGVPGCADHIDAAVEEASKAMRAAREAFDRARR